MIWPSIIWTSTAVELSAWLSVGIAVVLLATTWASLRATGPDIVVDPLTGESPPTPRWLAPGVHWLLPVTLAVAILLILFVPGH
jgi:Lhr-like helicase